MADYHKLSKKLQNTILEDRKNHVENPYRFKDENVVRRIPDRDRANLWRPAFVRDIEKIMNVPYYNRYSDKTQVFSFFKNDDISRRAYHVQLVARQARNIGSVLGLNTDLIEAIALGHDIGHTPFGHEGERQLSQLYRAETGRFFNHNVHSVRVLDKLVHWNISLQTLDGILCHNGELEQKEYRPCTMSEFSKLEQKMESCYLEKEYMKSLTPCTLEGCVMRICDIIAYLGKDRQDAQKLGMIPAADTFTEGAIGKSNSEIINNMVVNIIENSYGKPYLSMDEEYFDMLSKAKKENGERIYGNSDVYDQYQNSVRPMMERLYYKLLKDAKEHNKESVLYRHHVKMIHENNKYSPVKEVYEDVTEANQMVVDFIASMTDDYFVDLYGYLFPDSTCRIKYVGYFDKL
ncbi:MAG: HD domain-containing protein [Eubacteriales bacterium]|nr:HD domain-containing protein [Eubacteriales bacterium]